MSVFGELESNVQSYARSFPAVFARAKGPFLYDAEGKAWLDFLSGAGALNYGHNDPQMKSALVAYIENDGVVHGLDLHTSAKARFLEGFRELILRPRGFDYRVQFTGPTGTNCVEAALKLARKVTGRTNVVSFTNGFHGVSLGALAATGNEHHRGAAGITLAGVTRMPYAGYLGDEVDTIALLDKMIADGSSGVDLPAAVIVETVQGEGGLNAAGMEWLQRLEALCRRYDTLLIIDDIQAGCGRTGTFFSFEPAGIRPDIVTLSKSLSGYGLPLAVTLLKPQYDGWLPGEHNGTFRGNNHAFVTATAALTQYWRDDALEKQVAEHSASVREFLTALAERFPGRLKPKGRGLMQGLECDGEGVAAAVSKEAFGRGLIVETSGPADEVVKLFCPLTITRERLAQGLTILERSIEEVVGEKGHRSPKREAGRPHQFAAESR
jgi:diaminobutyrate-2-oxoglutarate transaminase